MGNASDILLLVSRIPKDHDYLMGSLYTIFGEQQDSWCSFKKFVLTFTRNRLTPWTTPPSPAGVLSVVGNGILLFVAYRKKSSLKPAEFFVVNLAISDLSMTMTLFPLAIPSTFAHMWGSADIFTAPLLPTGRAETGTNERRMEVERPGRS